MVLLAIQRTVSKFTQKGLISKRVYNQYSQTLSLVSILRIQIIQQTTGCWHLQKLNSAIQNKGPPGNCRYWSKEYLRGTACLKTAFPYNHQNQLKIMLFLTVAYQNHICSRSLLIWLRVDSLLEKRHKLRLHIWF